MPESECICRCERDADGFLLMNGNELGYEYCFGDERGEGAHAYECPCTCEKCVAEKHEYDEGCECELCEGYRRDGGFPVSTLDDEPESGVQP
jgi:hypothetical protein